MTFEEAVSRLPKDVNTVEAAESEIRLFVKDAVLKRLTKDEIKNGTEKIIKKRLEEIESEEIRLRAAEALPKFAAEIYSKMLAVVAAAELAAAYLKPKTEQAAQKLEAVRQGASDEELLAVLQDPAAYNIEHGDRSYFEAYNRRVRDTLSSIISTKARPQYGSHVNLRNIAEMTVRYDRQREHLDNVRRSGRRLVWIEAHANCSERCEPWQGRLYSLDGTSGRIDGIPFVPIELATDQFYTTKTGRTYKNGCITGYNCRHKTLPYEGPESRPQTVPAHVVEKKRAAEEEQRAMERRIRYEREKALFLRKINPKEAAASALAVKRMLAEYARFSRVEDLPRLDGRTRIAKGEGRIVKDIPKLISKYGPARTVRA